LAGEDIVRLILDGTVVRVRLDRRATSISLLVVLGVRRDGQKVLLAVKNMGGESEAAWRSIRACQEFCVRVCCEPHSATKRLPNMIANCVRAAFHSRGALFQF
jgi:transposase-like protein